MFDPRKLHPRHWSLRLLWDVVMVWIAVANLTLILFDLTYLLMRPHYLRYLPPVVRLYDPVKGIEPHPLTEELRAEVERARQLVALDPRSPSLRDRVTRLRTLSFRVLQENPFERSQQTSSLEIFKLLLAHEMGRATTEIHTGDQILEAVDSYWTTDPARLSPRLESFDGRMGPLLAANYHREVNLNGRLVDRFWRIDLPFLTLFIFEFAIRWAFAIRRKSHARWFFFPIFNWYDLLGLIPHTQFRVFRLFRIASIYMRLRRSELSRVGKDVLSRAVAYVSNIIAEEISDAVALRILNETQAEIRDGTHAKILERTIGARRKEIEELAVAQIRQIVSDEETQARIRQLLRLNLNAAVEESQALGSVPLPSVLLRPLVRSVGEVLLETTLQTASATLQTEEGQRAARDLVQAVLGRLLSGPLRPELDTLSREIGIDVIEHMKEAVAVKKWALPDPSGEPSQDR